MAAWTASDNIVSTLQRRECRGRGDHQYWKPDSELFFSNFKLKGEFNIHQRSEPKYRSLARNLRMRSRIVEIIHAHNLIFVLTHAGLCVAFESGGRRLCYVNHERDEVVRSLFFNKLSDSLITVSVCADDAFQSLRCRSIPVEAIRSGEPGPGRRLFPGFVLKWPGFVEFDEVNGKIVTLRVSEEEGRSYSVWSLRTYQHLFEIPADNIFEIKISPGVILLIYNRKQAYLPLKVLSMENGETLFTHLHLLNRTKRLDLIEQFDQKILLKQEGEPLQIVDILTSHIRRIPHEKFLAPKSSLFLVEKRLFLTFRDQLVEVWNFDGERVTTFQDHSLHPSANGMSNVYINPRQDVIFSYCAGGTINISSIVSGQLLGKITPRSIRSSCPSAFSPHAEYTLDDVSCICYNDKAHEIYVGNDFGYIYVLR